MADEKKARIEAEEAAKIAEKKKVELERTAYQQAGANVYILPYSRSQIVGRFLRILKKSQNSKNIESFDIVNP